MAKNQKHEKKQSEQHGDKVEISAEGRQTCEEELAKGKCKEANETTGADVVQSEAIGVKQDEKASKSQQGRNCSSDSSSSDASSSKQGEEPSVEELSKEVGKWKNEYLRKAADFENYRKRMIKEKKDAIDYANETILQDLVNVLDDFDRGIDAAEKYATEFLEFDKEDVQNLNILSEAYIAQKKYSESEKFFLPLAQKGNSQAQYLLALGYYYTDNLKEAETWAKKALSEAEKRKHSDNTRAVKELLSFINSKAKMQNKK